MNKIEELEKQLKEEMSKIQVDLKEKYKWIVGKYAKELQPYKGMGLCSECGRLATSPDGRDVVVPGKWHGKFPKKKATERY